MATVNNNDGSFASAPHVVMVENIAPTITLAGEAQGNSTQPFKLTLGNVFDPGDDTVLEYHVDWGDGSTFGGDTFETFTSNGVIEHTFEDSNGAYLIVVTLVDEDGTYPVTMTLMAVNEGTPAPLRLSTLSDPASSYIIEWGDGNSSTYTNDDADPLPNEEGLLLIEIDHTFDNEGIFNTKIFTRDSTGTATLVRELPIVVNNVSPVFDNVTVVTSEPQEGSPVQLEVNASDPGSLDVLTYEFDFDNDGTFETSNNSRIAEHTYIDDGLYTVGLRITDADGGSVTTTQEISVANVAPTIEISGETTVTEGNEYTLQLGDLIDPGADTVFAYTILWGDGQSDQFQGIPVSGSFVTHTYLEGPHDFTIQIMLEDEDGTHLSESQVNVSVNNASPVITQLETNAFEAGTVAPGEEATISANFSDLGVLDTHTLSIDWGDGSAIEVVPVDVLNGSGTLNGSHIYEGPGIYEITVTLTDDDGGTTQAVVSATINGIGLTNGTLNLIGTDDHDHVHIFRFFHKLVVMTNFLPGYPIRLFNVSDVQNIKVTAAKGNDHIHISSNISIPTILIGGDGHDSLIGGSGNDTILGGNGNDYLLGGNGDNILVGGDGNDWLRGGRGRDILIGGQGRDYIKGGSGDDILIGGFTSFDTNLDALNAISTEMEFESQLSDAN